MLRAADHIRRLTPHTSLDLQGEQVVLLTGTKPRSLQKVIHFAKVICYCATDIASRDPERDPFPVYRKMFLRVRSMNKKIAQQPWYSRWMIGLAQRVTGYHLQRSLDALHGSLYRPKRPPLPWYASLCRFTPHRLHPPIDPTLDARLFSLRWRWRAIQREVYKPEDWSDVLDRFALLFKEAIELWEFVEAHEMPLLKEELKPIATQRKELFLVSRLTYVTPFYELIREMYIQARSRYSRTEHAPIENQEWSHRFYQGESLQKQCNTQYQKFTGSTERLFGKGPYQDRNLTPRTDGSMSEWMRWGQA
ncbi:MAG: hypothetical protein KDK65_04115 [Chlamydiia bacterium]|nr:hypothetical protein [Chlamydiia bacterium]